MRYLYTGDLSPYAWSEARRRILLNMGRDVYSVDYKHFINEYGVRVGGLQQKLGMGPGVSRYNEALLAAASQYRPDIMWVDKGHIVKASTLSRIRKSGVVLVNFNTDYLGSHNNPWRLHLEGLSEYDIYFTSNRLDLDLLRAAGVRLISVVPLGYYAEMFRNNRPAPDAVNRMGSPVGFVGHWEPATERLVLELVKRGIPIRVRGTSWHHARRSRKLSGIVEAGFLPPDMYVATIVGTKINLGINSAINRNQSSGRSFEIPAAGGFLLGERTSEHLELYVEGREAEFYESLDELVWKVDYYLTHDSEREEIAANGQRRCIESGHSFEEIMSRLVSVVEAFTANQGHNRSGVDV